MDIKQANEDELLYHLNFQCINIRQCFIQTKVEYEKVAGTCSPSNTRNEKLLSCLLRLQDIELRTMELQLFSSNETVNDIKALQLPLLANVYHMSKIYSLFFIPTDDMDNYKKHRMTNLNTIITFLKHFIRLCEEINLVENEEKSFLKLFWEADEENKKSETCLDIKGLIVRKDPSHFREFKIGTQLKLVRLKESFNDSCVRTKNISQLKFCLLSAINELLVAISEKSMLSRENQKESGVQETRENIPSFSKILRIDENNKPSFAVINNGKVENTTNIGSFSDILGAVSGIERFFVQKKTRTEIEGEIFRPSWSQPTMTVEEYGEIERKRMLEAEKRKHEDLAEFEHKDIKMDGVKEKGLEDNEEVFDTATQNQRKWDDWKDDNPKGSGVTKRY